MPAPRVTRDRRAPGRAVVAVVVVVGRGALTATCAQPVCPRQAGAAQSEGGWW